MHTIYILCFLAPYVQIGRLSNRAGNRIDETDLFL